MSAQADIKILLSHRTGSKANSVSEFSWGDRIELKFGRDPKCDVVYDADRDDVVSRLHAAIRAKTASSFTIEDLGSRNGTYLNGRKVEGTVELLPDDVVALGMNGPSFAFDVSPRPAGMVGRTKIIDVVPVNTTRVVGLAATTSITSADESSKGPTPEKVGIGRTTMMHELGKLRDEAERARTALSRKWLAVVAVVAVICIAAGGALFWKQTRDAEAHRIALADVQQQADRIKQEAETKSGEAAEALRHQMGLSPQEIIQQFGPSTARVHVQWRLFDEVTGRPMFLKIYTNKNESLPLFAKFPDGTVVPYLVIDDENRTNLAISGDIYGTAFAVDAQGYMLTNKHLAAAWRLPFMNCSCFDKSGKQAWVIDVPPANSNKSLTIRKSSLDSSEFIKVREWVPESGGLIFNAKRSQIIGFGTLPDPSKNEQHDFIGRNEVLTVTFARNRLPLNATLVRSSNDNDVALIKVDSPQQLAKVDLADEKVTASAGERVIVLGYPAIAGKTLAFSNTIEGSQVKSNAEEIPIPYVTEGIVGIASKMFVTDKGITTGSLAGDLITMTINSTGRGNSGGPVFNAQGKVIGIFTYTVHDESAAGTQAIPIRYGSALREQQ